MKLILILIGLCIIINGKYLIQENTTENVKNIFNKYKEINFPTADK
jgi:hypothetical protein